MAQAGYIIVRNWRKRQHHKYDSPPWHKVYNSLLHDDDYLSLSAADRGVLHALWMLASVSGDGRVSADRSFLARHMNVRRVNLDPLIRAGFIVISESRAERLSAGRVSTESHLNVDRDTSQTQPSVISDFAESPNHAPSSGDQDTKRVRDESESVTTESETEQESTTDQSTKEPQGQPTASSKPADEPPPTPALTLIPPPVTDHKEVNAKDIDEDTRFAIFHLITALTDRDAGTIGRLVSLARKGAGPADFHDARQAVTTTSPRSPSRVACKTIENRLATRSTA